MNIAFLYLYLLAAISIGCLCIRKIKTAADYYVAGRKGGAIQIAGSLLATILGSSAILGSIDFAAQKGWAGAWFMLCGAFGLAILLFLVKPLAKFKGYNLPALLGSFYGNGVKNYRRASSPLPGWALSPRKSLVRRKLRRQLSTSPTHMLHWPSD